MIQPPSPSDLLRIEASKLRHAGIQERIIDVDGRVEERIHHYLTCKKCSLEKRAFEIEEYYKDCVRA